MAMSDLDRQIAAALCEQVYRRADAEQQIENAEFEGAGLGSITNVAVTEAQAASMGLTLNEGFLYNYDTGFVGRLVQQTARFSSSTAGVICLAT